jgi:pyruvoyl-dependent arginine decarboxylase (PvlArgDC)
MAEFNLENYVEVKDRVKSFWQKYPHGRILTAVLSMDGTDSDQRMVVVQAQLFATAEDTRPFATGLAKEREGTFGANKTAFLENAETSAIGRALANAGFVTDTRPSREEMESVKRREEEQVVALTQLKKFAKISPDLRKRIEEVWDKAKIDPVLAIAFAKELEEEISAAAATK